MKKISAWIKWIYFGGIFILPFIYWPSAEIPFEIPKVIFMRNWVGILGIFTISNILINHKKIKINPVQIVLLVTFFMISVLSAVKGSDLTKSISGNYYRQDGLYTLIHLIILSIITAIIWQKDWHKIFIKTVSISSIILSTLTCILSVISNLLNINTSFNWGNAVGATFGQPNFLVGYLLITLPFIAQQYYFSTKHKKIWFAGIVMHLLSMISTLSWTSAFGLFALIPIYAIYSKKRLNWKLILSFTGIILLFFTIYISWHNNQGFLPEGRIRIYIKAIKAFQQQPILGWGWANFDHAFDTIIWPLQFVHDVYVDKAHSHFLEILTTTGLVGLTSYLTLTIYTFRKINTLKVRKSIKSVYLLVFSFFIIHTQTNIISINEEIYFWILIGITTKNNHTI